MNQRMGAEDRQHAHVLLRVVQLVEAPQHLDAVIRQVHEPVASVHGHDDQRAMAPQRGTMPILRQHDPREHRADDGHEREREPVTSGTSRVAFNTVKRRSWRYPRATSGRRCAGHTRSTTRKTPMIARVKGPTTTTRRLVIEPAKSAPPQSVAHPTPIRSDRRDRDRAGGRYTRDDSATRSRRGAPACSRSRWRNRGGGERLLTAMTVSRPGPSASRTRSLRCPRSSRPWMPNLPSS